jgi:hypothetical protein
MTKCCVAVHYDVRWNTLSAADTTTEASKRRRSRTSAAQMTQILTSLGYTQLAESYWISPPGNETTIMSTLCFRIISFPGLRDSLCQFHGSKLLESPLDLLANIDSMVSGGLLSS